MATRRGILVIISSPSGAGKTTLARRLIAECQPMEFSVSYTTRLPRKGEQNGVDYFFVAPDEFERMVADGAFAEWAHVHGNRYGTARTVVESALAEGRDVVFDVDWQGGRKLIASFPNDSLSIFILPPDISTLEQRLKRRATDSEDVIKQRLTNAFEEMTHFGEYEYCIINDDLESSYDSLRSILRIRRDGAGSHPDLIDRVEASRSKNAAGHATALAAARLTRKS